MNRKEGRTGKEREGIKGEHREGRTQEKKKGRTGEEKGRKDTFKPPQALQVCHKSRCPV